jgi:hypothetical protein
MGLAAHGQAQFVYEKQGWIVIIVRAIVFSAPGVGCAKAICAYTRGISPQEAS